MCLSSPVPSIKVRIRFWHFLAPVPALFPLHFLQGLWPWSSAVGSMKWGYRFRLSPSERERGDQEPCATSLTRRVFSLSSASLRERSSLSLALLPESMGARLPGWLEWLQWRWILQKRRHGSSVSTKAGVCLPLQLRASVSSLVCHLPIFQGPAASQHNAFIGFWQN